MAILSLFALIALEWSLWPDVVKGLPPCGTNSLKGKEEGKITNQCVQLPNDTKRSGVEAVSHFTPKAFMEELAFLRG